ncbi:hypothetical protein [Hymenobacter jeollabukensis]|uniref:Uncharacterized protein n=1 Tax=Hymenobacter jeollabukensis TaxID=2025313 RepID=A0A5R8WKI3_9BACT|nr:hypothetical protein [Hymenobacter jeollabukensis]TLM89519.1 hypothetical protein FDY95_20835 [Hymenobacter jeollabukensis]
MPQTTAAPAIAPPPLLLPRLVALWALSEALLGGVLHALRLPVTGLLVGGAAVLVLTLLGHYSRRPGTILRALLVVLTIKALLSPHTSPNAYVAVAFQGLLGEMLSWPRALPRLRGLLLGLLTMVESAGQRVLTLWLLGGKALPAAFNDFVRGLLGADAALQPNYALWLVGLYFAAHAVVGAALGWWAGGLPARLPSLVQRYAWLQLRPEPSDEDEESAPDAPAPTHRPRRWRVSRLLLGLWAACLLLWLAAALGWAPATVANEHRLGGLLLRSVLLYGAWALLLGPWLTQRLHHWLTRPRGRWAADLRQTLALLPATRQLVARCWRHSAGHRGLSRLRWFGRALAVNTLLSPDDAPTA